MIGSTYSLPTNQTEMLAHARNLKESLTQMAEQVSLLDEVPGEDEAYEEPGLVKQVVVGEQNGYHVRQENVVEMEGDDIVSFEGSVEVKPVTGGDSDRIVSKFSMKARTEGGDLLKGPDQQPLYQFETSQRTGDQEPTFRETLVEGGDLENPSAARFGAETNEGSHREVNGWVIL